MLKKEIEIKKRKKYVEKLADKVSKFWHGAHLFLDFVGEDSTPNMDWYSVNFPISYLYKPDYIILSILYHEWGHRTISPESYEKSKVWELLVNDTLIKMNALNYRKIIPHFVINMLTDLWVDSFYINNPKTSSIYIKATKYNIKKAFKMLSKKDIKEKIQNPDYMECHYISDIKLFRLFLNLYDSIIKIKEKPDRVFPFKNQLTEKTYNIIFNEKLSNEERIVEFVKAIIDILNSYCSLGERDNFILSKNVNGINDSHDKKNYDKIKIIKLIKKYGIKAGGIELRNTFGIKDGTEIYKTIRKFELYRQLVDIVEKNYKDNVGMQYAGFSRWKVGEKFTKLEISRTIERFGTIIPNINTLKKHYMKRKNKKEGMANLCMIVDDSGSMINEVERLQEALFSIILAAEKREDVVSLIIFGSGISYTLEPSKDYENIKDAILSLEADSEGSVINPAIEKALEYSKRVEKQTTFIFTDTYLYDDVETLRILFKKLSRNSKIIIFAYSESEEDSVEFSKQLKDIDRLKIYFVRAKESYFEKSIKEIK